MVPTASRRIRGPAADAVARGTVDAAVTLARRHRRRRAAGAAPPRRGRGRVSAAGHPRVVGVDPDEVVVATASRPCALDRLAPGFWVGWCSFELGHAAERVVPRRRRSTSADRPRCRVRPVRRPRGGRPRRRGSGATATARVARSSSAAAVASSPSMATSRRRSSRDRRAAAGARASTATSTKRVSDAILELLRAGECYQVNLTRRLTVDDALDPVALYAALARTPPGAAPGLLRLSRCEGGRSRSCRRRPSGSCRGAAATSRPGRSRAPRRRRAALRASAKDHAENVMIVDLARNDLGRVCEPGIDPRAGAVRGRGASRVCTTS